MSEIPPTIEDLKPLLRPMFAVMAMNGILAANPEHIAGYDSEQSVAILAVRLADVLIAQLAIPTEPKP